MEGTSDTWKVPQIHGRYLRYIDFVRTVLKADYWDYCGGRQAGKGI